MNKLIKTLFKKPEDDKSNTYKWIVKHTLENEMCLIYICPKCNNTEACMSNYCRNCGIKFNWKEDI